MDWKKLSYMQKQLDNHIQEKHDVDKNKLFESKYLALLVELGELANETRCFKFWSTKPPSDSKIILEEYVDGLHFILSLGIEKGYQYESRNLEPAIRTATNQFNTLFSSCVTFYDHPTSESYTTMFQDFLQLGNILGYGEAEIMEAYKMKNDKNYVRQNEGY
ncbi:dUTP diphosphatase [Virgibacillus flavescens]|uniref:dUTP diphosphatase n=1 Tax=Virgibacillus flavescens TaxID=1611422 RepID=UPI003D32F24E